MSAYMKDLYRAVYSSLKSEEFVIKIRNSGLTSDEKERVIAVIKKLTHPSVASAWDAYELAKLCLSGLVPGVPKETIDDAKRIINEVKKNYPYIEHKQDILSPPEVSENPTLQELAMAISWGNRLLARLTASVQAVQNDAHSTLKGQCPFCLEDMLVVVKDNEIVLKCAAGSTPACKKSEWRIFSLLAGNESY